MTTSSLSSPHDLPTSDSARKPRLPAWARVVLPTLLMLPAASAGLVLLLIPGFAERMDTADAVGVGLYALMAGLVLAAYLLASWALVRWVDRRPFAALGLRLDGRALIAVLVGYAIAQAVVLLASWAAESLGIARSVDPREFEAALAGVPVGVVIAIGWLRAFVLQGIGEEVLFRGYLLQSLRRRPVLGVIVAALAFTAPHLASSGGQQSPLEHVLYLALPFGFALSAGFLAIALRSVWAAIGIHGGFHVAVFVAAALGFTADGPETWLVVGALFAVAGAAVAVLVPQRRWAQVRENGPYGERAGGGGGPSCGI